MSKRKFKKATITIDEDLVIWVNDMIEKKEFSSLSHAVQKALYELKQKYENKA